ncbi:MAG: BBP7 family outer membrane beta-barrel protein [Thermoguttaceae bacterium]
MKSFVGMLVAVLATAGIRAGVAADGEPPVPLAASEDGVAIAQDTDCADMQVIDCCRCDPVCRVRANALWMRLSRPNDAVLVTDFTPGGVVLLNASEFKFGAECGPEIAIVRQINDDWNLEGRFFRIDGWNATDTTIAGSYRSELTDVEINGRRRINDFWSLLLGFRYLGLDEGLTIQQGVNFGFATFTHNIRAVNDLYGLQIGADMNIWSRGRLSIEGLVKAGVYGDHAVNRTHIGLTNSAYSADSSASADRAAFAGEMSITGVYRLGKHLSLRGGYQYLWLAGVARASDQVAVSDPLAGTAAVSFKGSPSYDGAFVGLEFAR